VDDGPSFVRFLDPVSLINWVILCIALFRSNRAAVICLELKKIQNVIYLNLGETEQLFMVQLDLKKNNFPTTNSII
jgi:hypothetical protein